MSDLPLPPLAYHESPLAESICAKLTPEEGHFLDDLFGEHARTAAAAAEPRRTYEEFMAAPIAAEPVAYEYEHEDGGARLAVHVEQDHEGLHKSWTKIGDLFRAHSPVPAAEPVARVTSAGRLEWSIPGDDAVKLINAKLYAHLPTSEPVAKDFMFKGDVAKLVARISERYGEKVDSGTFSLKRHPLLLRVIDLLAHPPTSEWNDAIEAALKREPR